MIVQSYIFFEGRAEEALEFYKRALGAEVVALMRYSDAPDEEARRAAPAGAEDKVMHMAFRVGETLVLGSDGFAKGQPEFKGFGLALSTPEAAEADRIFAALSDGGSVSMPMAETFFSPRFGMVCDKFGVLWMVMVDAR